ncbi:MAG: hypothetical protein JWN74_1456 [Acidobacteriaceae bacterium]|nr:hypothetical protein [Acidobacteriaceae bacterium]
MSRNIEIWYAYCPQSHIPLFEIDQPPKDQHGYCVGCGVDKKLDGLQKGYVSHEERNQRRAFRGVPLSNPDSTPPPTRL